eukprot:scaffold234846_cov58-Attheya_sp.AAC.1
MLALLLQHGTTIHSRKHGNVKDDDYDDDDVMGILDLMHRGKTVISLALILRNPAQGRIWIPPHPHAPIQKNMVVISTAVVPA